jgi:outer membrane protein assembly factor BamB
MVWILTAAFCSAADWPQWRGPNANGISNEKVVPIKWGAQENIAWKAPLGGLGTSTPIVWKGLIYVTSQIGDGPFEQRGRDFDTAVSARKTGAKDKVRFAVQAFSRDNGKLVWEHAFDAEGDLPPVHMKHNLASPSCVTDGELLYAWMGTGQVMAFTLDGKLVWSRHLGKEIGPFQILWGHGSSPTIYKDSLILLCDHQGRAYMLSVDKRSGKQRWKVDRGNERRSYTTPFIVRLKDRDEMIINSSERIDAYDPTTGELLWHAGESNRVPIGMPVFHDGLLYMTRGYSSGPYMAIKPGGKGDVNSTNVQWMVPTGAPYVSSLLYYSGVLYMANEMGIASAVDAENGKTLWRQRLGGCFSASPVAADGKVYLVNENGEAFVLEAGREYKLLQKNELGERTLASPAISDGQIFLRTDQHLVAIGKRSRQ